MIRTLPKPGKGMPSSAQADDVLRGLWQEAQAAAEAYRHVSLRWAERPGLITKLAKIQADHEAAARLLEREMSHTPLTRSHGRCDGNSFARIAAGVITLPGLLHALAALQDAEQDMIAEYRRAADVGLSPGMDESIHDVLIPQCEDHIAMLDELQMRLG
jgi:hypothetical protein